MLSRSLATIAILIAALAGSAMMVVVNAYDHRQLFIQLQALNKQYAKLSVQFGQLKLEESAWSSPALIEEQAIRRLSMSEPSAEQLVVTFKAAGDSQLVKDLPAENFYALNERISASGSVSRPALDSVTDKEISQKREQAAK